MGIISRSKQSLKTVLKKFGFLRGFPKGEFVNVAQDFRIGLYPSVTISPKSIIDIDRNVEMRRYCNIIVEDNAHLLIEKNVFFNNYCSVNCQERIRIGANTILGEGVKLYDHNHKYSVIPKFEISKDQFTRSAIDIGSNCWIGSNVVVLKGVTIGDNVIVGANCLIYKSIPHNSIVRSKSEVLINEITQGNA